MKKTTALIYSIFAGIIYIFAILFLGINIYNEYSHGDIRTQRRWETVTNTIQQTSIKINPSSQAYKDEIENIITSFNDFAQFEVSLNGKVVYSYSATGDTETVPESKFIKKQYKAFSINNDNIYLSGSLYILRPTSIVSNTRVSFLIVLIITLITIILIISLTLQAKKSSEYAEIENDDLIDDSEDEEAVEVEEIDEKTVEEKAAPAETEAFEEAEPVLETSAEESVTVENVVEEDADASAVEVEEAVEEENSNEAEKIDLPVEDSMPAEMADMPKGLFNPATGLGWESYFMPRLENELNRAISSEIDLTLFIFKVPEMERTSELYAKITEYLEEQFQFKDLLFEYKEDSVAAIKIGMTIDEALSFADKLNEEIDVLTGNIKHYIGLSAKSIRMITAERLLKEASEAVEHAVKDPESCVIAFRADAAKYRKFIENQ